MTAILGSCQLYVKILMETCYVFGLSIPISVLQLTILYSAVLSLLSKPLLAKKSYPKKDLLQKISIIEYSRKSESSIFCQPRLSFCPPVWLVGVLLVRGTVLWLVWLSTRRLARLAVMSQPEYTYLLPTRLSWQHLLLPSSCNKSIKHQRLVCVFVVKYVIRDSYMVYLHIFFVSEKLVFYFCISLSHNALLSKSLNQC